MVDIEQLLDFLVKQLGSDLHLRSGMTPLVRIDGSMMAIKAPVIQCEELQAAMAKITPERNWKDFLETGDADFCHDVQGKGRFRVNILRHLPGMGIGAVFRVIPAKIPTAEEMGLPQAILKLCMLRKGLVLVTGPTGSGKSTTLAAMIDYINSNRNDHIITIEDPVEFVHQRKKSLITQREVGTHTKAFSKALRAALREDPDIVLVGEMRDLETTHIAIQTAETGHLVFGTLHTTTAASTIDRIVDQFPPEQQEQIRQMLSGSLMGVISQTLLKRKEGKGRVAAREILIGTSGISNLIRESKTAQIQSAMELGGRDGMITLNTSLLKLVTDGVVDSNEAMSKALDKKDFQQKLQVATGS